MSTYQNLSETGSRKQINKSNIELAFPQKTACFLPQVCIDMYGKNSGKYKSIEICSELQRLLNLDLLDQARPRAKNLIIEYFLNIYHNNE